MKLSTDIKRIREVRNFLKGEQNALQAFGFLVSLLLLIYEAEDECLKCGSLDKQNLAEDLTTDSDTMEYYFGRLVEHNLLVIEQGIITAQIVSNQVENRKNHLQAISLKRAEAGKRGAQVRWNSQNGKNPQTHNNINTLMANDGNAWQTIANDSQILDMRSELRSELRSEHIGTQHDRDLRDRQRNLETLKAQQALEELRARNGRGDGRGFQSVGSIIGKDKKDA